MTNLSTVHTFSIGDKVVGRDVIVLPGQPPVENPYPKTAGATATVVDIDGGALSVKWDTDTGDHGRNWGPVWFEPAEVEAPQRPLVHFDSAEAGRDRRKAREACAEAVSRVLDDEHNAILRAAADGQSVDAYRLNAAITAAIRSAATRNGQSTARREQAKRFAHVAHIVQAVLENHADNLPGYAPGERSRALADLKAEVASSLTEAKREIEHAGEVNQRLTQDLTAAREERATLTQAASDERRRLVGQIDNLQSNLSQTIREANEFEATLAFVRQFLTAEQVNQMTGFQHGFRVGSED